MEALALERGMMKEESDVLENFISAQRLEVGNILAARRKANASIQDLEKRLNGSLPEDSSFVVFGSLARLEETSSSDLDWTLMIDGQANAQLSESLGIIQDALAGIHFNKPGREGTFGSPAFSHELIHMIGGDRDSNRNTTQRVLLLLESRAIGSAEAYERVLRGLLKRYIIEDFEIAHNDNAVPRFLQNDISRYWRTVTVDFAYKRRSRGLEGWGLRTIKLRLSRKLSFASGLLLCFIPQLGLCNNAIQHPDPKVTGLSIMECLLPLVKLTPLERFAFVGQKIPELAGAVQGVFNAYDGFLKLLNDDGKRDQLEKLDPTECRDDRVFQEARALGHEFQAALDRVFFNDHPQLKELTIKYGVF